MIRIGTTQDLADTVGLLRQLAGVTQTALAEVMGCHPARIGEYERHRRKVSVRVALIHLKALGYELAVVPLDESGPQAATGSMESAEPPVPGVLGCAGVNLEALRGSEAWPRGAGYPVTEGCGSERRPVTDQVQFCHGTGSTCPRHGAVCR